MLLRMIHGYGEHLQGQAVGGEAVGKGGEFGGVAAEAPLLGCPWGARSPRSWERSKCRGR